MKFRCSALPENFRDPTQAATAPREKCTVNYELLRLKHLRRSNERIFAKHSVIVASIDDDRGAGSIVVMGFSDGSVRGLETFAT